MAKKKRPSVERFREFVKGHPYLVNEVRNKQATWQELFEEWYLLGEDHPRWQAEESGQAPASQPARASVQAPAAKTEPVAAAATDGEQRTELLGTVMSAVKNMDIGQIQQYISSANQAIGAIQGVLAAFQGNKSSGDTSTPAPKAQEPRSNPFQFNKD